MEHRDICCGEHCYKIVALLLHTAKAKCRTELDWSWVGCFFVVVFWGSGELT